MKQGETGSRSHYIKNPRLSQRLQHPVANDVNAKDFAPIGTVLSLNCILLLALTSPAEYPHSKYLQSSHKIWCQKQMVSVSWVAEGAATRAKPLLGRLLSLSHCIFFCWRLLGLIPGGTPFSQLNKGVRDAMSATTKRDVKHQVFAKTCKGPQVPTKSKHGAKNAESHEGTKKRAPVKSKGKHLCQSGKMQPEEEGFGETRRKHLFFLLAAAWVGPGRSALQSAEQWCKRRYGRIHQVGKMSFCDKNMHKGRLKQHTKGSETGNHPQKVPRLQKRAPVMSERQPLCRRECNSIGRRGLW